jgi:5'(3')-deoxyribonucleotidase
MNESKRRVLIDLDDTMCHYTKAMEKRLAECPDLGFPQAELGFFRNLEPIDGAIDAYHRLLQNFDVWFLTAPSFRNKLCYTEKAEWVERHLGFEALKHLIIAPDKSMVIGDFLVDDKARGKGQDRFTGWLIQFGDAHHPNWKSVIDELETLVLGDSNA